MTTKDDARAKIAELVDRFSADKDTADYNEGQMRHYYILPLFEALGWDTSNPADMTAEEHISGGFVDFGFYINSVTAFFLETKRARKRLDKTENITQAINYSYLKGVTWAVLTDFQRLMVFNADIKVKVRKPMDAVFLDIDYKDLAGERFDDLWLLSKPAMQTREIDDLATRYGKKPKKQPVTDKLFADLTQWRRALFREMYVQGTTLWAQDIRKVDNAVQRFLDRLIFIRTVEDRNVEDNQLKALLRQSKPGQIFPNLLKLFRELDDVYNSNLFAQTEIDFLEVHDPNLLRDIIDGLYTQPGGYAEYNFNAISADVLGAVYEQYLGFRAVDPKGEQIADEKGKKRKSQGIYYTPQYVVRYIVQQTLGKLLAEGADPHKLRILDPACGSGAFLIEAFDVLDKHIAQTEPDLPVSERRQRILKENIFGVDLDDQAVEVTRLNLMLRAATQREKLPRLGNIRHGNSLIDDKTIVPEKVAFNWEEEFPEIMQDGGFDVIVGNPPYGASTSPSELDYFRENYEATASSMDTFALFMEKSDELLKQDGMFGVIVPSGWVSTPSTRDLRKLFIDKFKPLAFASMPYDVFKGAYIDTIITIFRKLPDGQTLRSLDTAPVDLVVFPIKHEIKSQNDFETFVKQSDAKKWLEDEDKKFLITVSDKEQSLIRKIEAVGGQFSDIVLVKRGIEKYIVEDRKSKVENPLFAFTGTLRRYTLTHGDEGYIEYTEDIQRSKPMEYFSGPRILLRQLISRQFQLQAIYTEDTFATNQSVQGIILKKGLGYDLRYVLAILNSKLMSWYFLSVNTVARRDDFPKIIIKQTREMPLRSLSFTNSLDKAKHDDLVKLVKRMLKLQEAYVEAEAQLLDERFELKADIDRLDRQIDHIVYDLYGLTPEEIAIVEKHGS